MIGLVFLLLWPFSAPVTVTCKAVADGSHECSVVRRQPEIADGRIIIITDRTEHSIPTFPGRLTWNFALPADMGRPLTVQFIVGAGKDRKSLQTVRVKFNP